MKTVIQQCSQLLDAHNIICDGVDVVIKKHFANKTWLNETLGLNEKNQWRLVFTIPQTLLNRKNIYACYLYLSYISSDKYLIDAQHSFMFEDKKKNKYKVTTVLSEYWDNILKHLGDYLEDDQLADGRLFIMELYYKNRTKKDIKMSALCDLGELIKQNKLLVISTNPYDYFTASQDKQHEDKLCAYSSCISMNNTYFQTVLQYLESSSVLMTYTSELDNPLYKVGRMFAYVNSHSVLQTRAYGTYSSFDGDLILLYILDKILKVSKDTFCLKRDVTRSDFKVAASPYIDMTGLGYHLQKTRKQHEIKAGRCLMCGKIPTKDYIQSSGVCENCYNTLIQCVICARKFAKKKVKEYMSHYYCQQCWETIVWGKCSECGVKTIAKWMYKFNNDVVCKICYERILIKSPKPSTFQYSTTEWNSTKE